MCGEGSKLSFKKEDETALRELGAGKNGEKEGAKGASKAVKGVKGASNEAKTASKGAQNAKKSRNAAASSRKGEAVTPKAKKTANKGCKIAAREAKFIDLLLGVGRFGTKSIYARHGVEGGFSNRIFGLFTEDFVRKEAIVSKRLREELEKGFELLKNKPLQEAGQGAVEQEMRREAAHEVSDESRAELGEVESASGESQAEFGETEVVKTKAKVASGETEILLNESQHRQEATQETEVVKTKFDLRNFESGEAEVASSALNEAKVASGESQRSQKATSSRKTQPTQSEILQNVRKVCELLQKGEARGAGFLSAKFFEQSGDARFSVLADLCTLVWWCDGDEFMQMMAMRFEPRDLPTLFSRIAKVDANGIEKYADEAWRLLLRTFFHPQHEFVQYYLAKKLAKGGDLLRIFENVFASGERIEFGGLEDVADFLSRNLKSGEDEFLDILNSRGEEASPEMLCFLMNLEDGK